MRNNEEQGKTLADHRNTLRNNAKLFGKKETQRDNRETMRRQGGNKEKHNETTRNTKGTTQFLILCVNENHKKYHGINEFQINLNQLYLVNNQHENVTLFKSFRIYSLSVRIKKVLQAGSPTNGDLLDLMFLVASKQPLAASFVKMMPFRPN